MSDKAIHLRPVPDIADDATRANQGAIKALEDALEAAREGAITDVIIVAIRDDGEPLISWSPTLDTLQRLGALDIARHEVLHAHDGTEDEP